MSSHWIFIWRELILSYRKQVDCLTPLLFFVIITTLFPLTTNTDPKLLKLIAPGVIWVAALLSILLSLSRLFQDDFRDGSLEQMVLSPYPLSSLILLKVAAQWLILSFPLILISPLIGILFHLSLHGILILLVTLLLGTLTLNLLGTIVAALTVGLRNSGLLMALILLPLYMPTLIFASGAVVRAEQGLSIASPIAMLGALLLLSLVIAPVVAAFALRIGVAYEH